MSVEDADDLLSFFDEAEFAVSARWSFDGKLKSGIFDAAYVDPLGLFEATSPVFTSASDNFGVDGADLDQGQTLTIDKVAYTIVEVRPDGTGVVLMRLRT